MIESMTENTFALRPIRFQDHEFVKSVFAAVLPLYDALLPGIFEGNIHNMDILTEKGLDFNSTGLDGFILEAGFDAVLAPVGFAAVGLLKPQLAYLAALHFLPTAQRRGLGTQAMEMLEAKYRAQGIQEMVMLVHAQADWAQNFYLKRGYRLIARHPKSMVRYGGPILESLLEPGLELYGKRLSAPSPKLSLKKSSLKKRRLK